MPGQWLFILKGPPMSPDISMCRKFLSFIMSPIHVYVSSFCRRNHRFAGQQSDSKKISDSELLRCGLFII